MGRADGRPISLARHSGEPLPSAQATSPATATERRTECTPALTRRLLALPGLERLRLSSIEPWDLTDGLVDLMAAEPRFCPQVTRQTLPMVL